MNDAILKNEERVIFKLRELYQQYGYAQYKMSKFEEYDLYANNKDFLISDNVITFTDMNGKLMALKPDVTLSIVRNSRDGAAGVQKVYYNENVYRVSRSSNYFKEIMQVGLECIGDIDDYCIGEVLMLAARSLKSISEESVLEISQLDIVSGVVDSLGVSAECRAQIIKCIGEKNLHELTELCVQYGAEPSAAETLRALLGAYGAPDKVITRLRELGCDEAGVARLEGLVASLAEAGLGGMVQIDFSVMDDMSYYNGIVFKGFVSGVPSAVISGGQYDRLMSKMGRRSGAIGFAVYLDMLDRISPAGRKNDVDALLIYDAAVNPAVLHRAVRLLTESGMSVMAQREIPDKIRYGKLFRLGESGVETVE